MPKRQDPAEVIAFTNVQAAIGKVIETAMTDAGIAPHHAIRTSLSYQSKLATGAPIESAVKLVTAIQEATIHGPG